MSIQQAEKVSMEPPLMLLTKGGVSRGIHGQYVLRGWGFL
jgi:hypothetical protein